MICVVYKCSVYYINLLLMLTVLDIVYLEHVIFLLYLIISYLFSGKDSVTPEGNGQATEGNANNEKSSKASSVAQKQRDDATGDKEGSAFRRLPSEKKLGKKLPRVDATESKSEQAVDSARGTEPDTKTTGAVDQLGSGISFARKGSTKAVENIRSLEAEIAGSGFGGSGKPETAEGLSPQSPTMAGGRKLPRTLLDAGENESGALLAAPLADESDSRQTSTAKLYASGSSLNASELSGLRESRRRSSKAAKAESAAKYLGIGDDNTKLNDNKLRDSGRGSKKIRVNSKEIDAGGEAKASKIRGSTKKKKDGKKERNSTVDVTNNTLAESGIPKVESRPIEPADEIISTDINQNENHSLSLKNHLPDTTGVRHEGKVIPESSQDGEIKHGAKDPITVPIGPTKASSQEKEAKIGIHREPSAVKKKFLKEALVGEVARDGSLTSKGDVKPAKDMGIPEAAIHGDPSVVKRAESRKSSRVEPLGTKAFASASHSRDASIDSAGNSTLESSEGEKASDGAKAALLPSSESISAIGRSSFKASGEGDENEFNKAFKRIRTKQTTPVAVDDAPSRNSVSLQSKQPKDGDGVAATSSEKGIPESGSLKARENLSENRVGALGKSLRGSGRKAGGDSKPAENHSDIGEDKKPDLVAAEADAAAVDDGEGGSSLNKRKVPPAPPAVKRSIKVQLKPAEGGKEVAWASMARRMSRDFGDKMLQTFEAKDDEEKPDHDVSFEFELCAVLSLFLILNGSSLSYSQSVTLLRYLDP